MMQQFLGIGKLWLLYLATPRSLFTSGGLEQSKDRNLWPGATPPPGRKILKRRFDLAGCSIEIPGRISWRMPEASDAWHRAFFRFEWLRDIAPARPTREAASFAREFINSFIVAPDDQPPLVWEPDVAGARLALWMEHLGFLLGGSSGAFRRRLGRAIARHVLFLRRALRAPDAAPLEAVWGLMAATARLHDLRFLLPFAENALEEKLDRLVHTDGSVKSASPADQLRVLQILIDIRKLLPESSPMFDPLCAVIESMGTMLRFFCHGDGRLALFNGSVMEDAALIARAVELAEGETELPLHARAGFCRLDRKSTRVIFQSDAPLQPKGFHGALSFEFSDEAERIVVNCGAYLGNDMLWREVVETPAAHSTVSLEVGKKPALVHVDADGTPALASPEETEEPVTYGEQHQNLFADARSDAWKASAGFRHKRHLKLSRRGDRLSGADTLLKIAPGSGGTVKAHVRFHLHPDIRCQKQKDGTVLLTTLSGKSWIFVSESQAPLALEESVYLGYTGKPQKTLQIVLTPGLQGGVTETGWSLTRKAAGLE